MKKQYLLLLTLAAALANSLVAMEDPNDQRGQKRKRDDIVKSQANEGDEPELKEQKVDEEEKPEEKPFGDLSVLPKDILNEISPYLSVEDIISLSLTNKAFNKFLKGTLSKIRKQVLQELEEYKAQHYAEMENIEKQSGGIVQQLAEIDEVHPRRKLEELQFEVGSDKQPNAFHIAIIRKDKEFISRYLPLAHFFGIDIINQTTVGAFPRTPLDFAIAQASMYSNLTMIDIFDLFVHYGCIRTIMSCYFIKTLALYANTDPLSDQLARKLLPLLSCDEITTVYHDTDEDPEDQKNTIKAFIREHHKCDNCFPDNQ